MHRLELVADVAEKRDKLSSIMPMLLGGSSFAVYEQLSTEVRKDYKLTKATLVSAFAEDCFTAFDHFARRRIKPG